MVITHQGAGAGELVIRGLHQMAAGEISQDKGKQILAVDLAAGDQLELAVREL